jgi:hypothetical protein
LDHEFKEDEQLGEAPTIKAQFNEVGDYKQRVILHHTSYFQCQDGTTPDDTINQCIYANHTSSRTIQHEGITFYDALQTEVLEAPTSSQVTVPKTTIKCSSDFQQLRPFFGLMSANIIQKKFEHTT